MWHPLIGPLNRFGDDFEIALDLEDKSHIVGLHHYSASPTLPISSHGADLADPDDLPLIVDSLQARQTSSLRTFAYAIALHHRHSTIDPAIYLRQQLSRFAFSNSTCSTARFFPSSWITPSGNDPFIVPDSPPAAILARPTNQDFPFPLSMRLHLRPARCRPFPPVPARGHGHTTTARVGGRILLYAPASRLGAGSATAPASHHHVACPRGSAWTQPGLCSPSNWRPQATLSRRRLNGTLCTRRHHLLPSCHARPLRSAHAPAYAQPGLGQRIDLAHRPSPAPPQRGHVSSRSHHQLPPGRVRRSTRRSQLNLGSARGSPWRSTPPPAPPQQDPVSPDAIACCLPAMQLLCTALRARPHAQGLAHSSNPGSARGLTWRTAPRQRCLK